MERGLQLCRPHMRAFLVLAAATAITLWAQPATDPPLVVTGTLVDERGAPAAGVEVTLRPYPSAYELDLALLGEADALPGPADRQLSGPDGTFSLSAMAIGPYRLEIRLRRPAAEPEVAVPIVYRDILPLRVPLHLEPIELPNRYPLTVRALDTDGQPIEDALVLVDPQTKQPEVPTYVEPHEQPGRLHPQFGRASMRTNAEGVARFLMPSREAHVAASAPGFALRTGAPTDGRAALRLDRAPGVPFRVLTPDGRAAYRAAVRTAAERPVPLALTDEHGEATIGIADDGRANLEVETAGGSFARASVRNHPSQDGASARSNVEVRLEQPAAIPGRIADVQTGLAVPEAVVWVGSDPGRRAVADGSGRFDLAASRRRNRAEVGIVASGYKSATARATAEQLAGAEEMSIGLTAAAPLTGWIVDAFDRPIAGANVQLEPSGRGWFFQRETGRSGRATSGPSGSFWIDNALYGSTYRLTVEARTFASAQLDLPALTRNAPVEALRIVLTQGRQPWGTVVDLDGAPVAGAQIRLLWPPDDPEVREDYGDNDATESVTSNERGEFEFPSVAPGQYGLDVVHPEYIDLLHNAANVTSGEGFVDLGVFTLTPGAEIEGVVVGPNRRPVEGAEVRTRQRTQHLSGQVRTATTDQDGRFRLRGLLPALADIAAAKDGYVASVVQSVRPGTGESILIELAEGASLAGSVLKPDGTPAADVPVGLQLPSGELSRMVRGRAPEELFRRDRTDGDGRFRFDNVVPARWTAEARDETTRATLEGIALSQGELREIELRLETPDQLTVFVTNQLGEPVANADVRASPEDRSRRTAFGDTDAGGRATLWVATGPAEVEIGHPDMLNVSRKVVLEPGANELHVQLGPGGEISGVVRSVDGAPIPGVAVEASPELPGDSGDSEAAISLRRLSRSLAPPIRTVSKSDGSFQVAGLDRGRYRLVARLAGYTEGQLPDVIEIDGQSVADLEIVLEPGASIRGSVTGLDSADLASAEVQAWKGALFRNVKPGIDGNFELSALASGSWQVSATTGDRRSSLQELNLEPGGSGASVELQFEPGFRLSGQVRFAGEPATGGFVNALLQGQEQRRRTRTDHQGRFEMEGLAAGTYELRFRHNLGAADQSLDLRSDHYNLLVNLQPHPDQPN